MNIDNFDLNLLRAFDALMRERNVSRAGQRLSLSQPAMSSALNRLRELLDDPVMVRTSRGMQPTPKALAMEKPIRLALHSVNGALQPEPDFTPETSTALFRVMATDYLQFLLLPRLMRHLQQAAPLLQVEVESLTRSLPETALEEGDLDFALGLFDDIPKRLASQYLLRDELVMLVSAENPEFGDSITREQFLSARHMWVSGGQRHSIIDQELNSRQLSRRVVLTTPNVLMAPIIVANTDCVVVTPRAVARQYIRYLPLKMLDLPFRIEPFELHAIWHPLRAETAAHRWFRQVLENVCREVREIVA